jgi:hypothetical protein
MYGLRRVIRFAARAAGARKRLYSKVESGNRYAAKVVVAESKGYHSVRRALIAAIRPGIGPAGFDREQPANVRRRVRGGG